MITLTVIKAILPVCDVKNSNKDGNRIVCFFKDKITLKFLKTIRSSDPRLQL